MATDTKDSSSANGYVVNDSLCCRPPQNDSNWKAQTVVAGRRDSSSASKLVPTDKQHS